MEEIKEVEKVEEVDQVEEEQHGDNQSPQNNENLFNEIKQEVGKMLLNFEDRIINMITNSNSKEEKKEEVKQLDF